LWMNPSFKPDLSVKELLRNQIWAQRIRVAQWELVNKLHWGTVEILLNEWIYFLALFWKSFLSILPGSWMHQDLGLPEFWARGLQWTGL
jgi:hypothetical protein